MKILKIFFILTFGFLLSSILAVGANLPIVPTFAAVAVAQAVVHFSMPKGVAFFNFASLTWADGAKNMGGLQVTGYYTTIDECTTIPELFASPSTAAEEVTLDHTTTPFAFETGGCFKELYMTLETSKVEDEPQGEIDGQSFVHKAELVYPGTSADALAFAAAVNNSKMLFIFKESDGQMRVIGSKAFPARCKVTVTTGAKTADRKGLTIEIFSYGYTPAPIYEGDIELTPAS